MTDVAWGPSGLTVFERTYSRVKPGGEKETWPETVRRVVKGNFALVYGDDEWTWPIEVCNEYVEVCNLVEAFKIIPAGRHLWASGVKGRQFLMNCWTSGWGEKISDHFEFTFMRLMEGGGVGANYSSHYLAPYGSPRRELEVHIVCDPSHPDYQELTEAGVLSTEYDSDWDGAFEVEDSREGWASALVDLIDTYFTGDPVLHRQRVYDISRVRGRGSRLKTFGGTASGPTPFAVMMHEVSRVLNGASRRQRAYELDLTYAEPPKQLTPMDAMEIDHAIAECVVAGGNRRSARMSIVRWDDPYIFDFIKCKADSGKHWTTNISVEVDDAFFESLAHWGRVKGTGIMVPSQEDMDAKRASFVHKAVVQGMLTNGEPGYWNSSLSNHGELVPVYCTNPCGEITLQPWEACCLGHVNLDAFAPSSSAERIDEGGLIRAHQLMTRFLLRATYADISDDKSVEVEHRNRRIGVGHLGVQGFIVKNGWRYSDVAAKSTAPGYHEMRFILREMYDAVRGEARRYAFELRIPEPVKVTTVAPTGSVAKLPGATEGIHPIYARFFEQRIRFSLRDPEQVAQVEAHREHGFVVEIDQYDASGSTAVVVFPTKNLLVQEVEEMGYNPNIVEQANELDLDTMLAFQQMYQTHYADNAVSFTVNVEPGLDPEEVAAIIANRLPYLKGTTIMVDGTRPQAPLTRISENDYFTAILKDARVQTVGDDIDLECATGACPIR